METPNNRAGNNTAPAAPNPGETTGYSLQNEPLFPHETVRTKPLPQGGTHNPKGNLRAEQLIARATAQAGDLQQPEHYGLQGGDHRKAWVREGEAPSLAEIDAQDAALAQWAMATDYFVEFAEISMLANQADAAFKGQEHDVLAFIDREQPFVIRLTKHDMFGIPYRTPAEYLQRWRLSNAAFPDLAVSFIGYTRNSRGNGVVLTAQTYIEGTKRPQKAIDAAFAKLGFQRIPDGNPSYRNIQTGVEIYDAKPDNVIFDKAGNPQPFDVWINDCNNTLLPPSKPALPGSAPAACNPDENTGEQAFLQSATQSATLPRPCLRHPGMIEPHGLTSSSGVIRKSDNKMIHARPVAGSRHKARTPIERAAEVITNADGLIITAGAGMGVDSGLPDFRGQEGFWKAYPALAMADISFARIANPAAFARDPELAWGFYGHRLNLYRSTVPHDGFHLLSSIAGCLENGAFVYTSNVDGQFQKAGFPSDRIVECHGSIHRMQCQAKCAQRIWDAAGFQPEVDEERCLLASAFPLCPACGGIARPNILMFVDGNWIEQQAMAQMEEFHAWRHRVKNPVVIEFGAGKDIATVRRFGERLNVPLLRINPTDADVTRTSDVALATGALKGIAAIARNLVGMGFLEESDLSPWSQTGISMPI